MLLRETCCHSGSRSAGRPFFGITLRVNLAVHAATVLATLPALSALSGLLLTALMLSTAGLALAALLLLTGLLLPTLLRIALLLLRVARILLFIRHRDVLLCFRSPPSNAITTRERLLGFLAPALIFSATNWKITGKCQLSDQASGSIPPGADPGFRLCRAQAALLRVGGDKDLPGIREAADAWNISSSSLLTASRSVRSTA
jgi:hypothetical protein